VLQHHCQALQMRLRDFGRPSQRTSLPRSTVFLLPQPAPAQRSGTTDAHLPGNFGLTHPAGQQAHAVPAARFHARKVPASLRSTVHGRRIASVTYLCKSQ
jgi:hypothetical protein